MKSIAVAAAAFAAVEARNLARMEAQPTLPAIFALEGFSPAPTTPPSPEHVAARADSDGSSPVLLYNTGNTCGYVSGVSSAPYYCFNKGDYCALSTSASGFMGVIACCGVSKCNFRTNCVGYADIYTSKACNEECRDNTRMVKCTDTQYPFCNTVSFAGGIIDYACGVSDITTYQVLQTAYSGQVNPQSYTRYTVTGTDSSITAATPRSSGSATGAPSTTSGDSSSASSSGSSTAKPTSDGKSNKSSTPVGAIVGGVVGGVGAIALIGIGILLFLRRKKKDNNNIQQSPPPPLMSQPQTGGAPPSQAQYASPDAQNMAYSTSPSATGAYYPPQQQGSPGANYPQQQGSPGPNYPYSQPSVSPATSYAPQPYGQQGFGQQPYQQAGSPPPMQQQYGVPAAPVGAATGAPAHKDAPSGPIHEAPTATSAGHRGEMQELE
ncbi:hypothetical protein NLG97_g4243 [Lecanicillium saksenae]|uniref:Uncharacterized protein n=1 Tax=Lecanicillium saksenae TaxID=468837 RepID=A0ACC1QVU2_9HYPO|nr:hypothetical protein NLG97_g4243 [Lecanicillium saksenae]